MEDANMEDTKIKPTESRGLYHFDRMGRPQIVFDQRSNHTTAIMLDWNRHLEIWKNNQVIA